MNAADTVRADSRGFDAGKKINAHKRDAVVDTMGRLLIVVVTAASTQDRDRALRPPAAVREGFAAITLPRADGGSAGSLPRLGEIRAGAYRSHHQAHQRHQRFRGPGAPLGGRTHRRLDTSLAASGPRLRQATTKPCRCESTSRSSLRHSSKRYRARQPSPDLDAPAPAPTPIRPAASTFASRP
ncbi:transposase [Mycobacterium marinum]|uniref:transposase n=1 Tax=Mycobacterium marinum TaxID=1781 RepID=UPI003B42C387